MKKISKRISRDTYCHITLANIHIQPTFGSLPLPSSADVRRYATKGARHYDCNRGQHELAVYQANPLNTWGPILAHRRTARDFMRE